MTKTVVFLIVAIGAGFVVAEDAQDSAIAAVKAVMHAFSGTRDKVTKQDICTQQQVADILSDIPTECVTAVGSLDSGALARLDPITVQRFGDIFCQRRCSDPVIEYFERCIEEGRSFATFFRQLCARNDRGDRCSSAVVISSINNAAQTCPQTTASCSSSCQSALQTTTEQVGCCINILDVGGLSDATDFIEDSCNIDVPEPCGGSTLGAVGLLTGVLAMLVTVMFQ